MEAVKKAGTRGKKESEKRYVVVSRCALTYFRQEQREKRAFLFLRMNSSRARSHAKKVLKIRTFSLRRHRIKSFLSSFAESRMKKIFGIRTQQLLQLNLNRIMEQFLEIIREKRTFYHCRSVTVQTRLTR